MSYANHAKPANPMAIAAAVAVNGGIITALMYMSIAGGTRFIRPPIKTFEVPEAKAPKPPKEELKETAKQDPKLPPVYVPNAIVRTIDPPIDITGTNELPLVLPPPSGGTIDKDPKIAIAPMKPEIKLPPPAIFKAASRDLRFAGKFQPTYPVGMLQREIEGTVTVKVLIGTDGRVRQINIVSAATPEFAAATEKQALNHWRFKPATRGGEPVEDWQTLTVRFDIN